MISAFINPPLQLHTHQKRYLNGFFHGIMSWFLNEIKCNATNTHFVIFFSLCRSLSVSLWALAVRSVVFFAVVLFQRRDEELKVKRSDSISGNMAVSLFSLQQTGKGWARHLRPRPPRTQLPPPPLSLSHTGVSMSWRVCVFERDTTTHPHMAVKWLHSLWQALRARNSQRAFHKACILRLKQLSLLAHKEGSFNWNWISCKLTHQK